MLEHPVVALPPPGRRVGPPDTDHAAVVLRPALVGGTSTRRMDNDQCEARRREPTERRSLHWTEDGDWQGDRAAQRPQARRPFTRAGDPAHGGPSGLGTPSPGHAGKPAAGGAS